MIGARPSAELLTLLHELSAIAFSNTAPPRAKASIRGLVSRS